MDAPCPATRDHWAETWVCPYGKVQPAAWRQPRRGARPCALVMVTYSRRALCPRASEPVKVCGRGSQTPCDAGLAPAGDVGADGVRPAAEHRSGLDEHFCRGRACPARGHPKGCPYKIRFAIASIPTTPGMDAPPPGSPAPWHTGPRHKVRAVATMARDAVGANGIRPRASAARPYLNSTKREFFV